VEFDEYVREHSRQLLRLATVLARDRGTAEDIVQEVLIRAHERWSKIGQLSYPHAYVRKMVVNEATAWRRRWARIEPRPDFVLDRPTPTPGDQLDDRDELLAEIAKLPSKVRAAIVLRYFEDLPDAEIAELLACRAVTVRGYIHRGLRALRIELTPENTSDTTTLTRKASR
jgi:RNA polymerase sigma-70 factor (sigma-E family)